MSNPLLSPAWYRVAGLQPRLRSHVRIHRHEYRGARWYVLEDRISRRSHRFNPTAYHLVGLMDGRHSMQRLWDALLERFGDDTPTQDEVIRLLGQLHLADAVQCEVPPDVDELLRRSDRIQRRSRLMKWLAPLAVRFPLFDPDRLLERWLPWYRPLFGPFGALLWILVVGWGIAAAAQHWPEMTRDLSNRVLAPENILVLGVVFPLLKALHEFGHACAVKAWGGEVHEMGVMLLVLMPIPYVDASAANSFPSKHRRVVVGAAGMAVELFVASIALVLWLEMQPGLPRAVLFNVILIAGVTTVLFNANPLLRFDGYYILADLIEIPNLRARSNEFLLSLAERRLLGADSQAVQSTLRERAWFAGFAVSAFVYRMFITIAIAAFIATQYFIIGVLLAIWALVAGLVLPLVGLARYLALSPRLRRSRVRAFASTMALLSVLGTLVFVVPVPSWTNAQGVVWGTDQAALRSGAEGFVTRLVATPGSKVIRGQPLLEATDPLLEPRIQVLAAQREELEARYQAQRADNLVRAQITLEKIKVVEADLLRARERMAELVLKSPANGLFAVYAPEDLPGRFVRQGELVGYVIPAGRATARVVVPQDAVDRVRAHTVSVSARLAEHLVDEVPAKVLREVPRATDRLPSMALAQAGGGDVALDPNATSQARTLQSHFEFEIELAASQPLGAGGRVYVRFDHERETIAEQAWRGLQQLFLRRLSV